MIEERVPPQNIEAEQAVLGAMLIDKEAIAKATEVLSADDFYREAHRVIFSAMLELYNKNEAVDMVTVTEILKRDNKLEDIGGIAYITSLANVVLTAANVKYHAEIVAEKSVLRQLVRVSTEIAAMGYEANDDVGTLLDTAESRILEISNRKKKADFTPINDILMDSVQSIESLLQNKGGLTGIPAGFSDLDKLECGDTFYVHTLDETMAYMVLEINTVLPEDTSKLVILPAHDVCTLVTCTPYGVNTHRLMVRGTRIRNDQAEYIENLKAERDEREGITQSTWQQEYFKGIGLGVICIAAIGIVYEINRIRPRRRKRGLHEKG